MRVNLVLMLATACFSGSMSMVNACGPRQLGVTRSPLLGGPHTLTGLGSRTVTTPWERRRKAPSAGSPAWR